MSESEEKSSLHGGAREGAGRPRVSDEPMEDVTVYLPASYVEDLRRLGDGNVSAAVRQLVETWRAQAGVLLGGSGEL